MAIPSMFSMLAQVVMLQNAAPGGAPGGAPAAPAVESTTLLDYIVDGGFVSFLLIGCSIAAVSLVIRNILVLRRAQVVRPDVVRQLESLLVSGNVREAERFCAAAENNCFVTRVFGQALVRCSRSPFGLMEIRAGAEEAGSAEVEGLHRLNDGVGIIAAVSPMLGLLGTVIGMIGAFRTIGTLQGASRSTELASFMSMALVNTAEGLTVAIPCTVAFALFRRRIDRVLQLVGRDLERLGAYVTNGGAAVTFDSRERAEGRPAPLAGAARA